jgi:hypothetical protein
MVRNCFMELMEVVDGRSVDDHELLHGKHGTRGWKVRGWPGIASWNSWKVVDGRSVDRNCFMELMEVVDGRSVDGRELLHGTHGSRGWKVRGWSGIASWNSWKSWMEGAWMVMDMLHGTRGSRGRKVCVWA